MFILIVVTPVLVRLDVVWSRACIRSAFGTLRTFDDINQKVVGTATVLGRDPKHPNREQTKIVPAK